MLDLTYFKVATDLFKPETGQLWRRHSKGSGYKRAGQPLLDALIRAMPPVQSLILHPPTPALFLPFPRAL